MNMLYNYDTNGYVETSSHIENAEEIHERILSALAARPEKLESLIALRQRVKSILSAMDDDRIESINQQITKLEELLEALKP